MVGTAWDALTAISATVAGCRREDEVYGEIAEIVRSTARCDTIAMARFNPVTGKHETVVNLDYPVPVLHHLNTWFVEHDEVFHYMRSQDRKPLRWKDMPFPYESMFSAERVFRPSGFNEGVTVCLYNRDGIYTGALHTSAADRNSPPDDAMQLLGAAQSVVGSVIDWWTAADLTGDRRGAVRMVIDPTRHIHIRTAREPSETTVSLVYEALSMSLPAALATIPARSFLPWREAMLQIRARRHGEYIILDAAVEDLPVALTPRELEVATALMSGLTNAEIAHVLRMSAKTAARHVENIAAKLQVHSRSAAAVRCSEMGLRSWHVAARLAALAPHWASAPLLRG